MPLKCWYCSENSESQLTRLITHKRGAINNQLSPILLRLGIKLEHWIDSVSHLQKYFFDAAGKLFSLEQL